MSDADNSHSGSEVRGRENNLYRQGFLSLRKAGQTLVSPLSQSKINSS
jgi:hypothetical protein